MFWKMVTVLHKLITSKKCFFKNTRLSSILSQWKSDLSQFPQSSWRSWLAVNILKSWRQESKLVGHKRVIWILVVQEVIQGWHCFKLFVKKTFKQWELLKGQRHNRFYQIVFWFVLFQAQTQHQPWWKANFFIREPVLFGTWDGVFTSCMINIFGVVIFLRTGWMVVSTLVEECQLRILVDV